MTTTIAVFGLGEAGALLAADLAAAGAAVHGYDPATVITPTGVHRRPEPTAAVLGADLVMAATSAADAETALCQALAAVPEGALYADLSTASAGLKQRLDRIAAARGLAFADVALMSPVPGKGIRTPALASGPAAERVAALLSSFGMPIDAIPGDAGAAATRKLLRSVMMKGLAALVIEAMQGAERAGCREWLWDNLAAEITSADADLLARLVRGTGPHARRRLHEMEASRDLLTELGVEPLMTSATVENLRRALGQPPPELPLPPGARADEAAHEKS